MSRPRPPDAADAGRGDLDPADPARWLLPTGAGATGAEGAWDDGCEVVTYVSGLDAMSAMRDALEGAIAEAGEAAAAGLPPGRRGHVHLAAWRLNGFRDLSQANAWALGRWDGHLTAPPAGIDQTVLGLLLRLLQAGVRVRALLWLPTALARAYGYRAHIEDHLHIARVVAAESRRLGPDADGAPLGVVALDLRVAQRASMVASHHTKALVVRGHRTHVAFCGGVDLAYTRRHVPPLGGDWQSGLAIPDPAGGWPRGTGVDYSSLEEVRPLAVRQASDLPVDVYGDGGDAGGRQLWHDQHLRVEGPAVATVDAVIAERWVAPRRPSHLDPAPRGCWLPNQVLFSATEAFDAETGRIHPLPPPAPVARAEGATSRVQVWRTMPARRDRDGRGTFTVLAGVARACSTARELVWITDQYFWNRPLARLLNRRLKELRSLHVLLLLPPYADAQPRFQHRARALALADLVDGLKSVGGEGRVAVYDLWSPDDGRHGRGRGIYAHAKTQLYDGSLLVCGSANLNRRSMTCDTELDCAVLDRAVVAGHQRRLWDWMLMGAPWPGVDLDEPGAGARFFEALRAAANPASVPAPALTRKEDGLETPASVPAPALTRKEDGSKATGDSLLVPDPWSQPSPTLPGGIRRRDDPLPGTFDTFYDALLDPTALPPGLDDRRAGAPGDADLADLATRLGARERG